MNPDTGHNRGRAAPIIAAMLFTTGVLGQATKYEPYEKDAAQAIGRKLAEEIQVTIRPGARIKMLILPLVGDSINQNISSAVKDAIRNSSTFVVDEVSESTLSKLLNKILGDNANKKTISTVDEAIASGREREANAVLFGEVRKNYMDPEKGQYVIDTWVKIVDVKSGNYMFVGSYTNISEPGLLSAAGIQVALHDVGAFKRIMMWVIFLLVLPLVVLFFKEAAFGNRPLVPAVLMVCFTGLDLLFAYVLLNFSLDSVGSILLFTLSILISIVWNLFILNKIYLMTYGKQ